MRISPEAAVDKARLLVSLGWQVHIADTAGRRFVVLDFDRLLKFSAPASIHQHTETLSP